MICESSVFDKPEVFQAAKVDIVPLEPKQFALTCARPQRQFDKHGQLTTATGTARFQKPGPASLGQEHFPPSWLGEFLNATDRVGGPLYLAFARKAGAADLSARFAGELKRFKRTPAYRKILDKYGQ